MEKIETIENYIETIPSDKVEFFNKLRETIKENIPEGFQETFNYGMMAYVVPKELYPAGYHCDISKPLPFINLAAQKNFVALYHMGLYANKNLLDWFVEKYKEESKYKLDMGKGCIRFKYFKELPYSLIAELVKKVSVSEWIEIYEKELLKAK